MKNISTRVHGVHSIIVDSPRLIHLDLGRGLRSLQKRLLPEPCAESRRAVGSKAFCGARRSARVDEAPGQGFLLAQSKVMRAERACGGLPLAAGLALQDRPHGREGLPLAPGLERIDLGTSPLPLQFVDPDREIAQAREHGRSLPMRCAAGILPERDIAPVMRAVLDRRPVVADDFQHGRVRVLIEGQTARVEADVRGGSRVRLGRVLRDALDRDHLPAAAEADVLRCDRDPC